MSNTNQSNLVQQLNPATLRGSFIWLIIAIFASLVTYVLALFNIVEVSRENIFYGSSFLISFIFASLIATLILFTFAVLEKPPEVFRQRIDGQRKGYCILSLILEEA
ncbi:hypothetical protein SDC9_180154 [bioreactor metagenome]|uniref:Uncharacterized protein n=1 Tax=bioreactor metagenome TaxID=1076179 RepID=A0A645H8T3_9ZZZZ